MSRPPSARIADRRSAHFLSLLTWTREDFERVWQRASDILSGASADSVLAGERVAARWERASRRTAREFRATAAERGATLDETAPASESEPVEAVAEGWGSACAAVFRSATHARLLGAARRSPVPVVSAGTPHSHPFRVLADLFGLSRRGLSPDGLSVAWIGGPGPLLHSWLEAVVRFRVRLDLALPEGATFDEGLAAYVEGRAPDRVRRVNAAEARSGAQVVVGGQREPSARGGAGPVLLNAGGERPWSEPVGAALAGALLEDLVERSRRARGET